MVIRGDEDTAVTDHVGQCTSCQEKLESLAVAGANHLSTTVKTLTEPTEPSGKSAYWTAMQQVEEAVTHEFSRAVTDPDPDDEPLDLSFLRPSPKPGRIGRLGDFEVVRVIGKGGMGIVLHAFDPNLQRDVAIKILDPLLASNSTARQRFCREARSAAAVNHANIVTIYQVDEDSKSGLPYLVMQFVHGESLDKRLQKVSRLSVAETVRLGVQTAAGLAAAHASGLIHRDIKPGNILLERDTDQALLTDFGLARAQEDLKLTKSGMVAGTPLYMAPEQANGHEADHRADLFSLGSVLYEALAGKPAFDARTPLAVLRRIADDRHVPLREVNPEVPVWLEEVIEGLLEKDPEKRTGSAREVVESLAGHATCAIPALESTRVEEATRTAKTLITKSPPFRRLVTYALAASFALGTTLGGVGAYWLASKRQPASENPVEGIREVAVDSADRITGPDPISRFPSLSGAVWAATPSDTLTHVATGYESGRVQIWELATGKSESIDAHKGPVWNVIYSSDGKRLLTTSDDNFVRVWNLADRKTPINLAHPNAVRAAAMQQGGKLVVTGDRNGMIHIWSTDDQAETASMTHGSAINSIAMTPDGLGFASSGSDGRIVLWDIPGGRDQPRLDLKNGHRGPVYGLTYNYDGTLLASAGWDGTVVIWNAGSGEMLKQFKAHKEGVWAVDFSPCGNFLATGGQDNLAKLWDVTRLTSDTPELKATFSRHEGAVHSVHFFSDGTRLVSGSQDGSALVWDISKFCPEARQTKLKTE